MNVVEGYPPNYDEIKAAFNPGKGTIYCYGSTIYNPDGIPLSEELKAHEAVHAKQQGIDPAGWWRRYIDDPDFRLAQEMAAHIAEVKMFKKLNGCRNARARFVWSIAGRVSSGLYGSVISHRDALHTLSKKTR